MVTVSAFGSLVIVALLPLIMIAVIAFVMVIVSCKVFSSTIMIMIIMLIRDSCH